MVFNKFYQFVFNSFFPCTCKSCGKIINYSEYICNHCLEEVTFLHRPLYCIFPKKYYSKTRTLYFNRTVEANALPSAYHSPTKLYSTALHTGACRNMVQQLKYGKKIEIAKYIADCILNNFSQVLTNYDKIIPIPLHKYRLLKRGFNQSAEIARILCRKSGCHYSPNLLSRIRNTEPQASLNKMQRHKNVFNCFSVNSKYVQELHRCQILLLDDVYTTGATIRSAYDTIFQYEPQRVDILTFTRTPLY